MMKSKWFLMLAAFTVTTAHAAILVFSPDGTYATKSDLAAAAAAADVAGKTVIVTSPQVVTTAIVWPADRDLRFEKSGYVTYSGTGALTGLQEVRPEMFGANTIPGTTDMTAAITAAAACAKASKGTLILSGRYAVTKVRLFDAINYSIRSCNATLYGIASTAQTAILEIDNALNFRMDGGLTIDGWNNPNYAAGLRLLTSAGSVINPVGDITRVNIKDIMFIQCKLALSIGKYDADAQLSELVFNNLEMRLCPAAVYSAGTQTVPSFVGCNVVSEPNAAFPGAPEYAILSEGSFVTVVGGEVVLAGGTTGQPALRLQPGLSSLYQSPYGSLRFVGPLIETGGSPLFQIYNPRGITAPTSLQSQVLFLGCGGYVGSNLSSIVGRVVDSTYRGTIQAKGNNFYVGIGSAARTACTIDAGTSAAVIDVDKTSFGHGYPNGISGIKGGILRHE